VLGIEPCPPLLVSWLWAQSSGLSQWTQIWASLESSECFGYGHIALHHNLASSYMIAILGCEEAHCDHTLNNETVGQFLADT
jgi:hypothetical protein